MFSSSVSFCILLRKQGNQTYRLPNQYCADAYLLRGTAAGVPHWHKIVHVQADPMLAAMTHIYVQYPATQLHFLNRSTCLTVASARCLAFVCILMATAELLDTPLRLCACVCLCVCLCVCVYVCVCVC